VPRWPVVALRVAATAALVLTLGQPVLAGGFLNGYYPLLKAHETAAMILAGFVLSAFVLALVVRRTHGDSMPLRVALAFLLGVVIQITLGFSRVLIVHIPVGVALVLASVQLTRLSWRLPTGRAPQPSEEEQPAWVG
jgi:heme A synthase